MWEGGPNGHGASTSRRQVLASRSAAMSEPRQSAPIEHVVHWRAQARASQGRSQPMLSVGRDGIFVPMPQRVWQEGATAPVSM
jgi:hypothetical protein